MNKNKEKISKKENENLKRYVEREKVLEILKLKRINTRSVEVSDNIQECINRVKHIENADVIEIKHGEWVVNAWNGKGWVIIPYKQGQHTEPFCSCCKETAMRGSRSGDYEISNYCPNCGAKMDGGELGG